MSFFKIPETLAQDIDTLIAAIRNFEEKKMDRDELKVRRVPMGIYEQRKDGAFMVRIRCPGGSVTPGQLLAVAKLSKRHGSGLIHLTTRQELQVHDVALGELPAFLKGLFDAGLSTRGGGGNTVRNIMASPDSGIARGEAFDVLPHAILLTERLLSEPDSFTLPRKFKIAFSNSPGDSAHAAFNDLGFIATIKDGEKGFRVYVAGGMGRKPAAGKLLHEFVPESQICAVAETVKALFGKYGNRKNRHAARLRFLWNTLGEEGFRKLYSKAFEEAVKTQDAQKCDHRALSNAPKVSGLTPVKPQGDEFVAWKSRFVSHQKQMGLYSILAPVFLGKIDARNAEMLADFLRGFGENVLRLTLDQNFLIRNIPEEFLGNVFNFLKLIFPLAVKPRFYGNSIACAGADTCKLGFCLSRSALAAVHDKLNATGIPLDELGDFKLNISGCPNSCGAHLLADLGFFGKARLNGQSLYPAYGVVAGAAAHGGNPRFADTIGEVSARDLPGFTADLLGLYLSRKKQEPDFALFVREKGKPEIAVLLERYSRVPSITEDPSYYRDWDADKPFSLEGIGSGECSAGLFDLLEHDLNLARKRLEEKDVYSAVFYIARMLLPTRGFEPRNDADVFDGFDKYFGETGLVDPGFRPLIIAAKSKEEAFLKNHSEEAGKLVHAVAGLYATMDNALRFPGEAVPALPPVAASVELFKDYRGVACPMNFVKIKFDLSAMKSGEKLRVLLGDGAPIENVPRSLAEEGHAVLDKQKTGDFWTVLIRKG